MLLLAEGIGLTESTIGRILASLKRPYATRVPADKRNPSIPGALIQIDTVSIRPLAGPQRRQFTAIDVVSRCAVLGSRRAESGDRRHGSSLPGGTGGADAG